MLAASSDVRELARLHALQQLMITKVHEFPATKIGGASLTPTEKQDCDVGSLEKAVTAYAGGRSGVAHMGKTDYWWGDTDSVGISSRPYTTDPVRCAVANRSAYSSSPTEPVIRHMACRLLASQGYWAVAADPCCIWSRRHLEKRIRRRRLVVFGAYADALRAAFGTTGGRSHPPSGKALGGHDPVTSFRSRAESARGRASGQLGLQHLEGDRALVPQVGRQEDSRHPPSAQHAVESVAVCQSKTQLGQEIGHTRSGLRYPQVSAGT